MERKKIGEIATAKVVGVEPLTPISEILEVMRDRHISCVVVLENSEPVGIITERNIVSFAARQEEAFEDFPVRELMSSPVVSANRNIDIFEAYNLLSGYGLRHLVVVDENGHLAGVITQSDIVNHLTYESFVEIKKVSQVMSKVVYTVPPDLPVKKALLTMSEKSLSCMVVVDNQHPVGILTERDVAKLLIDYKDISGIKVGEVMTPGVLTAHGDTPLPVAVQDMKKNEVRRLVVVDQQGEIIGITTQSDIVKGLEGKYIEALHEIIKEKDSVIKTTSRDLAVKTVYLDSILDSSIDYGMIAADLNCRVVYFNPGAEQILNLKANEVVARDIREIHRENAVGPVRVEEVLEGIKNGERRTFIMERQGKSGNQFIKARASGIHDKSRQLLGYFLMISDITLQKRAEEQLQRAHADLEQRVLERTRQLAKAMDGTITAMALMVEMRDPYTSGHQRRVADLAAALARGLGLPAEEIEGVYMAGLIHDIGKIRVPSGILCLPGRLSEAEFSILKSHPEIGYNILKGIEFPWPVARIVHQHHEKIDGSGYPNSLRGHEISVQARILTVADVVEAMSSHRPYRPALGIDLALEEIFRNRGILYDEDVVDLCLELFGKGRYAFPPHQ